MSPKMRGPNKSERITLRLRPDQLEAINHLVDLGLVDSVSSAVREAVRDYIRNKMPQAPTVKASEANIQELGEIALQKLIAQQVAAAVAQQRKEMHKP